MENSFFILREDLEGPYGSDIESVNEKKRGDAPRCPVCNRYVSLLPWLPPYRVRFTLFGREFGDLVFGIGMSSIFASARFRDCCQEANITGVTFTKAEIVRARRKNGKAVDSSTDYFYLSVARGRAALDVARSEAEFPFVDCPECRSMRQLIRAKRIILEEGTWEGLDLFVPRGLCGRILTSARFANLCAERQLKNVNLVEAEKYAFDSQPWRDTSPTAWTF